MLLLAIALDKRRLEARDALLERVDDAEESDEHDADDRRGEVDDRVRPDGAQVMPADRAPRPRAQMAESMPNPAPAEAKISKPVIAGWTRTLSGTM